MKKIKTIPHKYLHNIVLGILLCFSLFMLAVLQGKQDLQFLVGFVTAVSYLMWGIVYHIIEKDLYAKVVVEYVLVSALGLALLYTALFV